MKIEINKDKLYSTYGADLYNVIHHVAIVICCERLLDGEKILLITDILEKHKFVFKHSK